MKGKKGNAASNRRRFEELEQRAAQGEHRATKAETEVRDLKAQLERQTTSLRRELADLRRQRDEAAAPAITALEQHLADVRQQRDDAVEASKEAQKRYETLFARICSFLKNVGFSGTEAVEITGAAATSEDLTYAFDESGVTRVARGRLSHEGVLRIQAAKGERNNTDLRKKLVAALLEVGEPDERIS